MKIRLQIICWTTILNRTIKDSIGAVSAIQIIIQADTYLPSNPFTRWFSEEYGVSWQVSVVSAR